MSLPPSASPDGHKHKRSRTSDDESSVASNNNDKPKLGCDALGFIYIRRCPADLHGDYRTWAVPRRVLSSYQDFLEEVYKLDAAPATISVRIPTPMDPQRIVDGNLHSDFWLDKLDFVYVTLKSDNCVRFEFSTRLDRNISDKSDRTIKSCYMRLIDSKSILWCSEFEQSLRKYIILKVYHDHFKLNLYVYDSLRKLCKVDHGDMILAGAKVICNVD
ncbi:hypothetical protein BDD12DRAFT_881961 [Trichophaea hybrida]|nr:hypothetical protein BDD12DRAFT_881961 [Trichophaea hybrida]